MRVAGWAVPAPVPATLQVELTRVDCRVQSTDSSCGDAAACLSRLSDAIPVYSSCSFLVVHCSGLRRCHPPTMPSADFSTIFSIRCPDAQLRSSEAPGRSPGVRHVTFAARAPDLQSASQLPQMEDFAVTCPLVPDAPRLISGFCSSPRSFGFSFLQTPPRGNALAVLLAFGSAKTWPSGLSPT